jgi:hypothetical protein
LEKRGFKQAIEQAQQDLKQAIEQVQQDLKQIEPILEEGKIHQLEAEFADEMRLGLQGQVRRVLAPRGVKIIQPLQREYKYEYLFLSVNPITGSLRWEWIARMKQELIKPILQAWAIRLTVWDGAGVHRGRDLAELGGKRIIQPAYSPELNPAERIFQEVRRWVEGKVYANLAAKRQAAEEFLYELAADPKSVISLCLYDWIEQALCAT